MEVLAARKVVANTNTQPLCISSNFQRDDINFGDNKLTDITIVELVKQDENKEDALLKFIKDVERATQQSCVHEAKVRVKNNRVNEFKIAISIGSKENSLQKTHDVPDKKEISAKQKESRGCYKVAYC